MTKSLSENNTVEVQKMKFKKRSMLDVVRDYIALAKPNIAIFCVLMAWGGMVLAPQRFTSTLVVYTLIGTALSVGAANCFNMIIERKGDKLMRRTRCRPLASERISVYGAVVFGFVLAFASLYLLHRYVNNVTTWLALFAMVSYALIYTPMKRKSPSALVIGTVPGAMPPLMGWTAVTGQIDKTGLVLFAILLLWQIPHFLAISVYNKHDYARAGIRTVPLVLGENIAKVQAVGYSIALLLTSLLLVPLGVAGYIYLVVAAALGLWFVVASVRGLRAASNDLWARQLFRVSLFYLPGLTLGLMLDLIL